MLDIWLYHRPYHIITANTKQTYTCQAYLLIFLTSSSVISFYIHEWPKHTKTLLKPKNKKSTQRRTLVKTSHMSMMRDCADRFKKGRKSDHCSSVSRHHWSRTPAHFLLSLTELDISIQNITVKKSYCFEIILQLKSRYSSAWWFLLDWFIIKRINQLSRRLPWSPWIVLICFKEVLSDHA